MATVIANDLSRDRISNYRVRLRWHCIVAIYGLTVVYGFAVATGGLNGAIYLFFLGVYASVFTL
jgi:hypothetical protein